MNAQTSSRIQGLDGLRAVSIGFVLLAHLNGTRNFRPPQWSSVLLGQLELGALGVRVFFVISGFLITTLLLGEVQRTGGISVARFYFRRTLRIFPPFYLYVAVIATLSWLGAVTLASGDLLHAITYTINYHRHREWHLGHSWSLSVEEQFYLLWPAVFRWLGSRRAVTVLLGYIVLAPVWRLAVAFLLPSQHLGIGETFFTTADSIATGCLLAIARPTMLECETYRKWVDSGWFYLLPAVILMASAVGSFAKLSWLVGMTTQNLAIAVVIERLTRDAGWMSRILNSRPMVLLGLWSYSVYLWQQLFLNRYDRRGWWTAFPANLLVAICVAAVSFYLVERPALRLRERLEKKWFPALATNRPQVT